MHLVSIRMTAKLEIMNREQVVVVHDVGQVGSTLGTHFCLFIVKTAHFFVEPASALTNGIHIHHIVGISFHAIHLAHDGFHLFVAKNRSNTSAAGLLQTNQLTFWVIESKIEHANQ